MSHTCAQCEVNSVQLSYRVGYGSLLVLEHWQMYHLSFSFVRPLVNQVDHALFSNNTKRTHSTALKKQQHFLSHTVHPTLSLVVACDHFTAFSVLMKPVAIPLAIHKHCLLVLSVTALQLYEVQCALLGNFTLTFSTL